MIRGRYSPFKKVLTDIGNITPADGTFIVGNGTTWVGESGDTARTSLGLGTGDGPTFDSLVITNNANVGTLTSGDITLDDTSISRNIDTSALAIRGGLETGPGPAMVLHGEENASLPGKIQFFYGLANPKSINAASVFEVNHVDGVTATPAFVIDSDGKASFPFENKGLDVNGDIFLQEGEIISNTDNGVVTISGIGQTNNESISFDLETRNDGPVISTLTGTQIQFAEDIVITGDLDVGGDVIVGDGTAASPFIQFTGTGSPANPTKFLSYLSSLSPPSFSFNEKLTITATSDTANGVLFNASKVNYDLSTGGTPTKSPLNIGARSTVVGDNPMHALSFDVRQLADSGTQSGDMVAVFGNITNSGDANITGDVLGADITIDNAGTGTHDFAATYRANTILVSGGGTVTDGYGLYVESQNQATNNWAIKTNVGKVEFGDSVFLKETTEKTNVAGFGQIYCVDNSGTTELWFSDDAGNDTQLA
jgi:hypothetical protein